MKAHLFRSECVIVLLNPLLPRTRRLHRLLFRDIHLQLRCSFDTVLRTLLRHENILLRVRIGGSLLRRFDVDFQADVVPCGPSCGACTIIVLIGRFGGSGPLATGGFDESLEGVRASYDYGETDLDGCPALGRVSMPLQDEEA